MINDFHMKHEIRENEKQIIIGMWTNESCIFIVFNTPAYDFMML